MLKTCFLTKNAFFAQISERSTCTHLHHSDLDSGGQIDLKITKIFSAYAKTTSWWNSSGLHCINQQSRLALEFILDLNFQILSNYFGAFSVLLGQFMNIVWWMYQWWAKSKIGHHCDGRNFFSQLSFLSSQKPRHFMYITWINNHCTPQKHQWDAAIIKHVTVATHLKVLRAEFCSKIPSVAKNTFSVVLLLQLCNFTKKVYYTIKQPINFSKKGKK